MPATTRFLLLVVIFLPLASAVLVPLLGRAARRAALWLAMVHLVITAAVVALAVPALNYRSESAEQNPGLETIKLEPVFVPGENLSGPGAPNRTTWTLLNLATATSMKPGPRIQFFIGIDGFNVWLVALSSLMLVIAILVSWESIQDRPAAFHGWLFLLQAGAIGAFLSFDVILFYVFFELTLIPAFFLIGGWGNGSGRRDAARKFFLYTLAGSLLTLVGVVGIALTNPNDDGTITFSLPDLMGNVQKALFQATTESKAGNPGKLNDLLGTQQWFFWALMAGFMVKVPIWPFHTWLPPAYNESPIGVTILLASLLAKLGTFGILRFVLTLTPDAALACGLPVVGWLAAFGIVYAALCAYNQKDIKLTIAYSSVSHLGFLVLGLFAFNREGMSGAVLHMLNHGLSTGALFALLAFLLDRYRTTQTSQYGGLMGRFSNFAVLAFVIVLASIGLPGLNNFVSEMLMLAGLFIARNPTVTDLWPAVIAASGILLSAWYMLTMLQRVFFNPLKLPEAVQAATPTDLNGREGIAFGSLAILCLVLGLAPQFVLDTFRWEVRQLDLIANRARERAGLQLPPEDNPTPTIGSAKTPPPPKVNPGLKGPAKGGGQKGGGGKGGKGPPKGAGPKGGGGNGKMMIDEGD